MTLESMKLWVLGGGHLQLSGLKRDIWSPILMNHCAPQTYRRSVDVHTAVSGAWVHSKSNSFILPKKQSYNTSPINQKLRVWYISATKGIVPYNSSLDFPHFLGLKLYVH